MLLALQESNSAANEPIILKICFTIIRRKDCILVCRVKLVKILRLPPFLGMKYGFSASRKPRFA